jgi:hypothetical protein
MDDYSQIPLSILVFGPSPEGTGVDHHLDALREKREQIRQALRSQVAGHTVHFGEELRDSGLPSRIAGNAFMQEMQALRNYDLVFVLVRSYGTNVELGQIAARPEFSAKAILFLDETLDDGYAAAACKAAVYLRAQYYTYRFPNDLTECHLLTRVEECVQQAQFIKFLS